MNSIEHAFRKVKLLTSNELLLHALESIQALVTLEHSQDIALHVPVGDMDVKTIDSSEYSYGDQYDVGCYYEDSEGNSFSESQWEENIDDYNDRETALESEIEEIEADIEELEDEINEDPEDGEGRHVYIRSEISDKQSELATKKSELSKVEDYLAENRGADIQYEEIYWNTVWCFRGSVNEELARELNLGVMTFTNDAPGVESGEQFLFLQGCGMDLTPKLVAYQAIEFGRIDPDYVSKLEDPQYFKYVVGDQMFQRVVESLGVTHLVEMAEEQAKARMEAFVSRMDAVSKLRDESGDGLLAGFAALATLHQSEAERPSSRLD